MADAPILALAIDVEEEGLFGGRYDTRSPGTTNTACLVRLAPLLERGLRPTLFCAHSVLADNASRRDIASVADAGEIGLHLHHWNTPPLAGGTPDTLSAVPTTGLSADLLAAKLASLMDTAADFLGRRPTSFRMGRWDMRTHHWAPLARAGILCDASIRPLHAGITDIDGPDHFTAPRTPYWINVPKASPIFEVPLTVTPICPPAVDRLVPATLRRQFRSGLRTWGALALLPVYHPLWLMKLATVLHIARNGKVLSLTWHSSEMCPGATPQLPTAEAVDRFMDKMVAYVDWLRNTWPIRCLTMDEVRLALGAASPTPAPPHSCDWAVGKAA
jgi:hypothetical protein